MSPLLLDPPAGTAEYKIIPSVVSGELRAQAQGVTWISVKYTTAIPDAAEQQFAQEKQAFLGIPPRILAQYTGQFVVSSRGAILESDQDLPALVSRFFSGPCREVPVYIAKVGEDENEDLRIETPFLDD